MHLEQLPEGGLHLEQRYRAMDLLAGAKGEIERALFFETADLLSADVDLIFYDTTSLYTEREGEDEGEGGLTKWGHSRDERPDRPQVVVGLAMTRDGLPVRCWVWPGVTEGNLCSHRTDVTTLEEVERDLGGSRLGRVVYVADGGMMSEENLEVLGRGGHGYVLGVPLKKSKEAAAVLARPGRFQTVADNLEVKALSAS